MTQSILSSPASLRNIALTLCQMSLTHPYTVYTIIPSMADCMAQTYCIMPYTSTGRDVTTSKRSLGQSEEESLIISNLGQINM